jgi:hypothetical protein
MFIIECRQCGFYFDADVPDRNICITCLREAEQTQMIETLHSISHDENLKPKTAEMSTPLTEKLPFCPP